MAASMEEHILRTTKEIVIKFIEVGRVSPTGFHETFLSVHKTVAKAVADGANGPDVMAVDESE